MGQDGDSREGKGSVGRGIRDREVWVGERGKVRQGNEEGEGE
jgi:hypothetical protein